MAANAVAVFLGALLLFLVQPMLARIILPWYGGSPAVWTACMLFFQVFLLAGYLYAHWIGDRLRPRKQATVHLLLLTASLLFLPAFVHDPLRPSTWQFPVGAIFGLLSLSIGLPYLLLSSSSTLLQKWTHILRPRRSPYRLYALSNLGSLLGLLLYPFVMAPLMGLRNQTWIWSIAFGLYVVVAGWCAVQLLRRAEQRDEETDAPRSRPGSTLQRTEKLLWFALAATGSVVLLATTNQMCRNVPVVPLLWVLPLSLYLLTFVLCFRNDHGYRRKIWIPVMLVSSALSTFLLPRTTDIDIRLQILIYSLTLFSCCMVCHGELARGKPSPGRLTVFYLMVAGGGAAGGIFVGLLAPLWFKDYWEFFLGLLACTFFAGLPLLKPDLGRWPTHFLRLAWTVTVILGAVIWVRSVNYESPGTLVAKRNFFGVLRVVERNEGTLQGLRQLWHGDTVHGSQFLNEVLRRFPTHYYGFRSGVALAIENHPRREAGLDMGVVGLGTGTLAVYAKENDTIRFYEIDGDVVDMAREYFSYLENTPAEARVVLGDARVLLERELREKGSRRFDLIALDAFTSDAIPVHLLTKEAFALYREHLQSDGVLAVHISNRHFDLEPLVEAQARELGWKAVSIENGEQKDNEVYAARWVIVTSNETILESESFLEVGIASEHGESVVWTDDYINLLGALY
jgi:hypothetical protein